MSGPPALDGAIGSSSAVSDVSVGKTWLKQMPASVRGEGGVVLVRPLWPPSLS